MFYQIKYWLLNTFIVVFSVINFSVIAGNYRENLALHHPCNSINKRLSPYITWTEKLASTQYKVQKDACGQIGPGPACCTHEIMHSYAVSFGSTLKTLLDTEINHLTRLLTTSKQQIDSWSKEYIIESRRLTISSLETLFGTKEYRSNVHHSVFTLFSTLSNHHASVDDVSRSTIDLLNHLIISLYRQFMINDTQLLLDDAFQKCLVNKAFEIDALPAQRELLYILTSGSSLIQIFHTMLVYMDADIQRLKSIATLNSNPCIQRYAREALCPICASASSSSDQINELLCEDDCQYLTKTCFNQTNNPYVAFGSIVRNYSGIIQDIEQAIIELKLVERLSKLHIYLYDMVVRATNSRSIYMKLQSACPNPNARPFSPILSLPPTITERRELVFQWNRSLHFLLKQLQSSIDNLNIKLTHQIITDICSNSNYAAVKSNRCTQIDKQTPNNFIQWPLPSIPPLTTMNINHVELTRNQLDELKKKMMPIQQMILSLRPKKKYSLIEHLPDFDSYNDEINTMNGADAQAASLLETDDNDIQESLSEQLYKEIDGRTTHRSIVTTTAKHPELKHTNSCSLITYNIPLYLIILHRCLLIN